MEESLEPQMLASTVRYVSDLADDNDYWLSITDAARVTRRQDVTIRRWIKSGALPVRKQSVGLNQRTRQVRASDLEKLTPIIDNSAAITSAEGRLDLVNIPVEQATIRQQQQQLLHLSAELQATLEQQARTTSQALAEQQAHFRQALVSLQEQQAQQFEQFRRSEQEIRSQVNTQAAQIEQYASALIRQTRLQETLYEQVARLQEMLLEHERHQSSLRQTIEQWLREDAERESQHREEIAQLQATLLQQGAAQQQQERALEQLRQDYTQHIERQDRLMQQHLQMVSAQLTQCYRDIQHLHQALETFTRVWREEIQSSRSQAEAGIAQLQQEQERVVQRIHEQANAQQLTSARRFDSLMEHIRALEAHLSAQQVEQKALKGELARQHALIDTLRRGVQGQQESEQEGPNLI